MRLGKYPQLADRAWLYDQYVTQQKSTTQIGREVGCTFDFVGYRLRQHEIPIRPRGGGGITHWEPKQCARCGEEFTPNGPAAKFCADCRHRPRTVAPKQCKQCEKEFTPQTPIARYCSKECLNASKRYGHRPRLCERCGEEFQPSGPAAMYCSAVCRAGARSCEQCGKVFGLMVPEHASDRTGTWTVYQRRFCSDDCVSAWRSENCAGRAITPEGYVEITVPSTGHRDIDDKGYSRINLGTGRYGRGRMREHRWVMEQRLGRRLLSHEEIHHKNMIRSDNDRCPRCPADTFPPRVVERAGKERLHCEACGWLSSHTPNLELWETSQPRGGRVADKITWAIEFLSQYGAVRFIPGSTNPQVATPAADGDVTTLF